MAACCGCGGLVGCGEGERFAAVCCEGRYGIANRDRAVAGDGVGDGRVAVLRVEGGAGGGVGSGGERHRDLAAVLKDNVACGDVSGDVSVAESDSCGNGYRISRLNIIRDGGSVIGRVLLKVSIHLILSILLAGDVDAGISAEHLAACALRPVHEAVAAGGGGSEGVGGRLVADAAGGHVGRAVLHAHRAIAVRRSVVAVVAQVVVTVHA